MPKRVSSSRRRRSDNNEGSVLLQKVHTLLEARSKHYMLVNESDIPYVALECQENGESSIAVDGYLNDFIHRNAEDARSLFVIGECGSGKSTLLSRLECQLWDSLDFDQVGMKRQFIPFIFQLKELSDPSLEGLCLKEALITTIGDGNLTMKDLEELERNFQLSPIWLLDGFAELNDAMYGTFEKDMRECGISIVTCDEEFYKSNAELFQILKGEESKQCHFEEIHLLPFNEVQTKEYIEMRIKALRTETKEGYISPDRLKNAISAFPELNEVACIPFSLEIVCTEMIAFFESKPELKRMLMENPDTSLLKKGIAKNKVALSMHILSCIIKRVIERNFSNLCLYEEKVSAEQASEFIGECENLCEELAFYIFKSKSDYHTIDLSDDSAIEEVLSKTKTKDKDFDLIFKLAPLKKKEEPLFYAFASESYWEYFLVRRIVRLPLESLGQALFTHHDHNLLSLHASLLAENSEFQKTLEDVLLSSRAKRDDPIEDKELTVAASNALSILNLAAMSEIICFDFKSLLQWKEVRAPDAIQGEFISGTHNKLKDSSSNLEERSLDSSNPKKRKELLQEANEKWTRRGHDDMIKSIASSSDGRYLATGGNDNALRVWDTESGECLFEAKISKLAFAFDTRKILMTDDNKSFLIWDNEAQMYVSNLKTGGEIITNTAFSSDGEALATVSSAGTINLWNLRTKQSSMTVRHSGEVKSVHISPNRRSLVAISQNNIITIWDIFTGQRIGEMEKKHLSAFCFKTDGGTFAVCTSKTDVIELFDVNTLSRVAVLTGHPVVIKMCFSPNRDVLYSMSKREKNVKVWDLQSLRCIKTLGDKDREPTAEFTVSNSGLTIATICPKERKRVIFWDASTFECVGLIKGAAFVHNLTGFRYSLDDQYLLLTQAYFMFQIVNIADGKRTDPFGNSLNYPVDFGLGNVYKVGFSPDGNQLASVDTYSGVKMWDSSLWQSGRTRSRPQSVNHETEEWKTITEYYLKKQMQDRNRQLIHWCLPDHFIMSTYGRIQAGQTTIEIFEVNNDDYLLKVERSRPGSPFISISFDGSLLAYNTQSDIRIIDLKSMKELKPLNVISEACCFHPDNCTIATAFKGEISLWDSKSASKLKTVTKKCVEVSKLCFLPDGSSLISTGYNGIIAKWDVKP